MTFLKNSGRCNNLKTGFLTLCRWGTSGSWTLWFVWWSECTWSLISFWRRRRCLTLDRLLEWKHRNFTSCFSLDWFVRVTTTHPAQHWWCSRRWRPATRSAQRFCPPGQRDTHLQHFILHTVHIEMHLISSVKWNYIFLSYRHQNVSLLDDHAVLKLCERDTKQSLHFVFMYFFHCFVGVTFRSHPLMSLLLPVVAPARWKHSHLQMFQHFIRWFQTLNLRNASEKNKNKQTIRTNLLCDGTDCRCHSEGQLQLDETKTITLSLQLNTSVFI